MAGNGAQEQCEVCSECWGAAQIPFSGLRTGLSPNCPEGGRLTSFSCSFSGPSKRGAERGCAAPNTKFLPSPVTEMRIQKASPCPPGGATLSVILAVELRGGRLKRCQLRAHACFAPSPAPPATPFLLRAPHIAGSASRESHLDATKPITEDLLTVHLLQGALNTFDPLMVPVLG